MYILYTVIHLLTELGTICLDGGDSIILRIASVSRSYYMLLHAVE